MGGVAQILDGATWDGDELPGAARLLRQRIATWRPALVMAAAAAVIVGSLVVSLPRALEWVELALGVPAILAAYCAVIWRFGFGAEDRALFKRQAKA